MKSDSEVLAVSLSEDERDVLIFGLREWGGPARCTDALALVMGFGTVTELLSTGSILGDRLSRGEAMARSDWRRVLLATEIVFASDVLGSGVDWETTTRFTDAETIRILRSLQRKIAAA